MNPSFCRRRMVQATGAAALLASLGQRVAARLHEIRPGHHADAGHAILQRNEPEPAVLEPEDDDVAFVLAFVAAHVFEMAVHRHAVVLRVLVLDLETAGQKGVAARRIDHEARCVSECAAVVATRLGPGALGRGFQIDRGHLAAFAHMGAQLRGAAKQHLVELGPAHLVGVRHGLVPRVGKQELLLVFVPRRHEFGRALLDADGAHFIGHAQALEQGQVGGQQRFTNVKTRVAILVQQHYVAAFLRQQRRHRAAGRAAANDQNVAFNGRIARLIGRKGGLHGLRTTP